jgi:hypothetical protein
MMEEWNVGILGMESGKRSISIKMLSLHFLVILIRQPYSALATHNAASEQENQCKNMRLEFRFL